jgi:hypothetical protein
MQPKCGGQQCGGQRAADNSSADISAADNSAADKQPTDLSVEVKPVAVTCVREAARRRDLLLLPGRRRLRHTSTACGTRVRACIPQKLAACSRQWTTGRRELQPATNRTSHRAGPSDHTQISKSAHPRASEQM